MPQMSPLNWTLMFMVFLTLLMTLMTKMYFSGLSPESDINPQSSNSIMPKSTLWKW